MKVNTGVPASVKIHDMANPKNHTVAETADLIIVSNRGPFSFTDNFLKSVRAHLKDGVAPDPFDFGQGGLVQAMSGLLKQGNTTWIGASMGDRDIDVARGHYTRLFNRLKKEGHAPEHVPMIRINADSRMHFMYQEYNFDMRFVFFDTIHMHSYYGKFANGFLWPLIHLTRSPLFYKKSRGFPRPRFEKNDFVQYTSSSVTFANTILDEVKKSFALQRDGRDIVVWNQDYHLMQTAEVFKALVHEKGLPPELRDRIHVGQFMHTPFFNIHEIQGLIREDKRNRVRMQIYDPFGESIESVLQKLIWGMLANDFIGFHTKEYCDNYLEALEEWFPVEIRISGQFYEITHQGQITTIGAFPIGLDVDRILSEVKGERELSHRLDGQSLYSRMQREKKQGMHIFGGLERCDYTKGLVARLDIFRHAYRILKERDSDARFYQVTAPSRLENPDYQNLRDILREEVALANKQLKNECIIHIPEGIPAPENYRFMKEVDAMLVTPLEDGMNLVAFEYILSQKFKPHKQRGILLLSTSGASRVLKKRGYGEEDGIVYINPLRTREAGRRAAEALSKELHISERVIRYVEEERRVGDWARQNVDAILHCRKQPHGGS
jgi:trehalose-6-phosphate synthase